MKSGLPTFGTIAKLLLMLVAAASFGLETTEAQHFGSGAMRLRDRCNQCFLERCRCRPKLRFLSPNRFLCDPSTGEFLPSIIEVQPDPAVDPSAPGTDPSVTQPSPDLGMPPTTAADPDSFALASGQGSGFEAIGFRDTTIGDFFGGGGVITGPSWGGIHILTPIAAGDRRFKLTEHTSPIPSNRVFFNYNVFSDALIDTNGNAIELNRYTMGIEQTLFRGNASVELRIPILNGVSSDQLQSIGGGLNRNTEFGNMSLTTKLLLLRRNGWAYSTGLGIIFPTAASAILVSDSVNRASFSLEIENEAYHLQPFFAVQRNPDNRTWFTFYTQADFASGGNTVMVTDLFGTSPPSSSVYNDQNLLFLDLSMGRWFYQARGRNQRLRGIAAILEFHYTTTLNDTDSVSTGTTADTLSNPANRLDVLNATLGFRFLLGDKNSVTVSGVAPLRDDFDKLFDGELSIQLNRRR